MSCIANDFGYEEVFARQVQAHGRAGDILLVLSTRGDSPNTGVDRLGTPGYNWGVEILHGAGIACIGSHCPTILPVLACAAGLALTLERDLGALDDRRGALVAAVEVNCKAEQGAGQLHFGRRISSGAARFISIAVLGAVIVAAFMLAKILLG